MRTRLNAEGFTDFLCLAADGKYNVKQIQRILNHGERRVYRNIKRAEALGFLIDIDFDKKVFINPDRMPEFIEKLIIKRK